ncbi:hypothetical protein F5878DRAFT_667805 [Lentinula raphanica]|uniref:Uncharacterized protein n=1 Tax=Lentinula raphanica TaxID=153919 RepID=A0AA38NV43_9AGAR|nr:hypothetical protein F5878DRAFT_667805 [Lentinula raphanica]
MSFFNFSCSREEIEAALDYFAANSISLPSSVYQFYQTLQTQIIAAEDSTQTSLLRQTQTTHSPQTLHLFQEHIHSLPTPSPSPPRTFGPRPFMEIGDSHSPPHPLFPAASAPSMHTIDGVQQGDAQLHSVQAPSVYSGDLVKALPVPSNVEIQSRKPAHTKDEGQCNDVVLSNDELRGPVGPGTAGPLGNTVHSGGDPELGELSQAGRSTNIKRKWTNGTETEQEREEGRGSKNNRGGKSKTGKSKSQGYKSSVENKGAGGRRGGGGGGGGGRSSGCPRNGASIRRRTRAQLAASVGSDEGLDNGRGEGSGLGEGSGGSSDGPSDRSFIYSPTRAPASKDVQEESFLLLLSLYSTPESLDWVPEFTRALEGESWAQEDALATESLENLALRCSRSKSMSLLGTFCRMLNELMFTAKVNSIFHAQKLAQPSKMPSLEGILRNLKHEGFRERDLGIWLSSGSRWARLASAGIFKPPVQRLTVHLHRDP